MCALDVPSQPTRSIGPGKPKSASPLLLHRAMVTTMSQNEHRVELQYLEISEGKQGTVAQC
jgi:hypothetical protein